VIIFGFLPEIPGMMAVAVAFSMAWLGAGVEPPAEDDRARNRLAALPSGAETRDATLRPTRSAAWAGRNARSIT
jgi:hypothetical protein